MRKNLLLSLIFILFSFGCKKEIFKFSFEKTDSREEINNYIYALPKPAQEQESELKVLEEKRDTVDGRACVTRVLSMAEGKDEVLTGFPVETLMPGMIVSAQSVLKGSYIPFTGERGPLSLSISLPLLEGPSSISVQEGRQDSILFARQQLLQSVHGVSGAKSNFEISEIYSENQLGFEMGLNFDFSKFKLSSNLNFDDKKIKSRFLVRFSIENFKIFASHPKEPSAWVKSIPSSWNSSQSMVYSSSESWGKLVVATLTSYESSKEVNAALNTAFQSIGASGELALTLNQYKLLKESSFRVTIFGGDSNEASKVTSLEDLMSFIKEYGGDSKTSVPIAYTLRYLSDNSIFRIVSTGKFPVQECTDLPKKTIVEVSPQSFYKLFQHTGNGDKEFGGRGPLESVDITFSILNNQKVIAHIKARVLEVDLENRPFYDKSEGVINKDYEIYNCGEGYQILNVPGITDSISYKRRDGGHGPFYQPIESSLVKELILIGDTGGVDLADRDFCGDKDCSSLEVVFRPVSILIQEK